MATRLLKYLCIATVIVMVINACVNNSEELQTEVIDTKINLKWFDGSFEQSNDEVKTGFAWTLSSLGAQLHMGSMDSVLSETGENLFEADLSKAGFSKEALNALGKIIFSLKSSEAYKINDYVEMGRFIMLTLNSSYHYYEITQAPKTLSKFRSRYKFNGKQVQVINSGVSDVQRLLEVADANTYDQIAHISSEGQGTFEEGTFKAQEFEVFDYMPNGQTRFIIYDETGSLKSASDPTITRAGKPSKCFWCHEINIQPFFTNNPVLDGSGFLSKEQFIEIQQEQTLFLAEYRASLDSDINYLNLQDHSFMEYLYIDFMEPSIGRVAAEWNMDVSDVTRILANVPTHIQGEYSIENVYHRKDIELIAPFKSIEVPESARELSVNEPNIFGL